MFGLGKKNNARLATKAAAAPGIPEESALGIPEENFVVMPEQYLPTGAASSSGGKKLYWLVAGAGLFLAILSGGLYMFFFSTRARPGEAAVNVPIAPVVASESGAPPEPPPQATSTAERVVESPAYDSSNQLVGNLKMSVPALVANKYGESLGITVLLPADISLPTESEISGGIYSLYPIGATFSDPIAFELGTTALSTP